MRKPRSDTHQECRSLLQKAVRRGETDLVTKVVNHLQESGDGKWLRSRLAVIAFEECWPLASELPIRPDQVTVVNTFRRISTCVKYKDAAGLGTLAYAFSKGDDSVLENSPRDRSIRLVSEAIRRPNDYWLWVIKQCDDSVQAALVDSAYRSFRRGGWPWDRAFMQAAAYLAVSSTIPALDPAKTESAPFPFFVALDKHTLAGRQALKQAATELGLVSQQVHWLSFYYESAITNQSAPSHWWSREVNWRLGRVGINIEIGEELWSKLQPIVASLLQEKACELERHLNRSKFSGIDTHHQEQLWSRQMLPEEKS